MTVHHIGTKPDIRAIRDKSRVENIVSFDDPFTHINVLAIVPDHHTTHNIFPIIFDTKTVDDVFTAKGDHTA